MAPAGSSSTSPAQPDLRLREVRQAAEVIRERADPDANVIFGASFSDSLEGDVLVTLIATGLATPVRSATPSVEAAAHADPPRGREDAPPAEDPAPVPPSPAIPVMAAPKRPARTATVPPREVAAAPRQHIQPRSAGGPELPDQVHARSTNAESDDLDVPSFLRRSGRPASQA